MMIFVLGCDGYLGNALTQRLLVEGHNVIGFDNFWRRKWVKEDMESISAFPILRYG
jgi:nucleoside-diphosphate-sugar epimerase